MKEFIKPTLFILIFVVIWSYWMKSVIDKQYEGLETVCVEFKSILIMKDGEPTKTGYATCTQKVIIQK